MELNFVSTKEAAEKNGVTERWVQQLCKDGKIEGAGEPVCGQFP